MATEGVGLEMRMEREARRLRSQHSQLGVLDGMLREALAESRLDDARTYLDRFAEALDAHFELEDRFYFPAVHGMKPELEADLAVLSREHQRYREEVSRLKGLLADGLGAACEQGLLVLGTKLAEHERREERLLSPPRPD